jgi:hypothetical protein
MNLPPFEELEIYAAGQGDLPQRFYMDPEFAEWRVSVADHTLPVHKTTLGMASKVFCGMLHDKLQPTEPIPLLNASETSLAQALALLRFIYDTKSLTEQNTRHLSLHNNLGGVLRLAHSLDIGNVYVDCRRWACSLVVEGDHPGTWKRSRTLFDSEAVMRYAAKASPPRVLAKYDLVKDIRGVACTINDDVLQEACYTYVSMKCNEITQNYSKGASTDETLSFIDDLSQCSELVRAALFFLLKRNSSYTGKTYRRLVGYFPVTPEALFTFKYQLATDGLDGHRSQPDRAPVGNQSFPHNNYTYSPTLTLHNRQCHINIAATKPQNDDSWPHVHLDFSIVNWTDPAKSVTQLIDVDFRVTNRASLRLYTMQLSQIYEFVDEDNILVLEVRKITTAPADPPQNADNNN